MSDYIKREGAIEAIDGIDWYKCNDRGRLVQGGTSHDMMFLPYAAVIDTLKSIPAADVVERKKGEWIWTETGDADYEQYWVCSECSEHNYYESNYCPNCGADMRT